MEGKSLEGTEKTEVSLSKASSAVKPQLADEKAAEDGQSVVKP